MTKHYSQPESKKTASSMLETFISALKIRKIGSTIHEKKFIFVHADTEWREGY